jgi:hypothetical protein
MSIPPRFFPIIIIVLSLTVRIAYYFQFQNNPFFDFVPPAWDQDIFDKGGKEFAHGNLLAKDPNQLDVFSPLYKYFLGTVYWIFGETYKAVWSIQFLLGTGSTLLIFKISNYFFRPIVGLLASLLFTFYGPNWLYEGSLYRSSLTTFLTAASCYGILWASYKPTIARIASSAALLSLVMQCRSNNLLLVPVGFFFIWRTISSQPKNKKTLISLFTAVFILCSIPLLYRGYLIHNHVVFYDQGGPETLLMSNLPDYPGRGYSHSSSFDSFLKNHPLTTPAVIKFLTQSAWENPKSFFELYLRKLFFLFNNYEAPTTLNYYLFQEISPILQWGSIPFAFFGSFGILGIILLKKNNKKWTILHAYFFTHLLMYLPFYSTSRFRLPVIPFLVIFSAHAIYWIWKNFRRKQWTQSFIALFLVLILTATMKTYPTQEGKIRISDYSHMGSAYLKNARTFNLNKVEKIAIKLWNKEINADLQHKKGSLLLSTVYDIYSATLLKNNQPIEAAKNANLAFEINPFHSLPFKILSIIYQRTGDRSNELRTLVIGSLLEIEDPKVFALLTKFYDPTNKDQVIKIPIIQRWLKLESDKNKVAALKIELNRLIALIAGKKNQFNSEKNTARNHFLNHRWEKAVDSYSKLNQWNSIDASLYLELGVALGKLNQSKSAIDILYSGLLINPNNPYIHRMLSNYYFKVENSPYMSAIHLRHYLKNAKKGTDEYKEKEATFNQFRFQYGSLKRKPILPTLSVKHNLQALEEYNLNTSSSKN